MLEKTVNAENLDFKTLNAIIREQEADYTIENCYGQRYIGAGLSDRTINIYGTPGNAMGAYMDGASITVFGNAQDAVGDTMNSGSIVIHGGAGDALGYGMRGGNIYIKNSSGYRTGIHMKEYKETRPVIVVGGGVGSFLGEYMAGGLIIVLGIGFENVPVGNFTGIGMHGGKIFIRTKQKPDRLPEQVLVSAASRDELQEIEPPVRTFADLFGMDFYELLGSEYYLLKPNATNPYHTLYTPNLH